MNPKIEGHEAEDRFSREVLEFPAVLELLRGYLSGPISEPCLDSVEPHTRIDLIRHELEQAREAREYLRESPRPTLGSLRDPRPLLEKLRIEGAALEALEIFALTGLARAAHRESNRDAAETQDYDGIAPRRPAPPCGVGVRVAAMKRKERCSSGNHPQVLLGSARPWSEWRCVVVRQVAVVGTEILPVVLLHGSD